MFEAVSSPVERSERRTLLLAIALLALVLRLIYIWQISHAPFFHLRLGDAAAYHEWAERIAAGDWRGEGVFYQAPLYPYFLASVYSFLGDGVAMVRFIQAVIGAGSCVLLGAAGMSLFGRWGAGAGVLLAMYPPAIFLDGLLEKTALVTFFTAALLCLIAAEVRFRALIVGVVLGLLALTRENALLLAVPILSWFAIGEKRPRAAAVVLVGAALVLWPVGARNYAVGGEFHLTTSQFGPNFYIGNHAGANGLYDPLVPGHGSVTDERTDATRIAEQAAGRRLRPSEVSAHWTSRALQFIRAQPGMWLEQLARKLALTYNAIEVADTESQEVYAEWSSLLRLLSPLSFGVLLCLAVFGICLTAPAWRRLWFLHAIGLTYTVSVVMFYVFARYRFPLVPVLALLAAGGLVAWPLRPARPMRGWATASVVLAASIAFMPLENTHTDRVANYVNIGNALLAAPDTWDEAAMFYGKALNESPRSPAAHFGMGTLLTQKRQPKEAVGHYQTAVEGWPENVDLRLNYALALVDVGDTQGALKQLDAAATLRAGDGTADLLAGKVLLTTGRYDEARQRFERVLVLNPADEDARDSLTKVERLLLASAR